MRGRSVEAILDANKKVDRAFQAGALALGAKVEIETLPGYMPMTCDPTMTRIYRDNAAALVGAEHYREIGHRTGSTDSGRHPSMVMPILHPYMGGATGSGHGADYQIVDQTLAYLGTAKALASMVVDLMADGATGAREVLKSARPPMTREQYLAFQRGIAKREVYEGVAATAAPLDTPWRVARGSSSPRGRRPGGPSRCPPPPSCGSARRRRCARAATSCTKSATLFHVRTAPPAVEPTELARRARVRCRSRPRAPCRARRTRCNGRTDTRDASACR